MKIAMVSLYLPGDSKIGVGHQVHGLANELVRRGHDVVVMSPDRPGDSPGYEHVPFPVGRPRLVTFPWRLRAVDWRRFDVVHAHGDDWFLGGVRRPPHVRTVHGSCLVEAAHIRGARQRTRMLAIGAAEAGVTAFVADRSYGVSRATRRVYPWLDGVIPCGVDVGRFGGTRRDEDVPTILFVGTYGNRKRGHLLHAAFEQVVRPSLPSARLWMVCDDAPAAPGVEVLGHLTDRDLADRYRRAWAFCLPSSYEGFGVPYVEAMASGCPVVATRNAGALEVLDGGRYGRFADSTPAELGRALVALLRSSEERSRLRDLGRARSEQYSWSRVARDYEQVYEELRAAPRRRPTTGAGIRSS